jgi:PII-like signaling protein
MTETTPQALKLVVYLGERDHSDGRLLADVLMERFARAELDTSVLFRGVEGFGVKHRLATERSLTLSEDLPLLAVAIDRSARIEGLVEDVRALCGRGLVTLERARLLELDDPLTLAGADTSGKLTIFLGRQWRVGSLPGHVAATRCLHRHGVAAAITLLGLDGTLGARRRRARFHARNRDVPVMVLAVGGSDALTAALAELRALLPDARIVLERATLLGRGGAGAGHEPGGLPWQKLVLYSACDGGAQEPRHAELVRALRHAGAAGATTLRGEWGFAGGERPHGERLWSMRRRAPLMTVTLDSAENVARWREIAQAHQLDRDVLTCEQVPALRAAAAGVEHGGLDLAAAAEDRRKHD